MKNIFSFLMQSLFILLFFAFILGEIARVQFGNGIALTALDIAVGITNFSWIVLLIFKKEYRKTYRNYLSKPSLYFLASCILSLIIASFHLQGGQILVATLYLIRFVLYGNIYFIASCLSKDMKLKKRIIQQLYLVGAILVLLGFLQFIFYQNLRNLYYLGWDEHLYRMFSTFLDPNYFGGFLVLFLFFLFGNFKKSWKTRQKGMFGILEIVTIIALILTYSRGALIMFVFSIITLLILLNKKKLIFGLILIVIFVILILSPRFYLENNNLFRSVSTTERINSVNIAIQIIQKNPIFGVGFNAYKYAQIQYGFRQNASSTFISHADSGTDNSFLFVLATTGIIGFTAFIYLLFAILKYQYREFHKTKSIWSAALFCSLVGLLVNALTINSLFYPFILVWVAMTMGIIESR